MPSQNRLRQRSITRLIAIAAVVLLLLWLLPVRKWFGFLQQPFVAAGTWVGNHSFGLFDPHAVSSTQVTQLQNQLAAVSAQAADDIQLKTDNDDLRQRLDFAQRTGFKLVSADILARSIGVQTSQFTINRGSQDGLTVGMPAVVGNGVLAGKVIAVSSSSATVSAITDRNVSTAASLLNGARTIGIATGLDGTLLSLEYIPKDETVNVNDLVVTSGLEDAVPGGLVIGIVNAVQANDIDPFKTAVIEPSADVRRIDSVSIIVGHQP